MAKLVCEYTRNRHNYVSGCGYRVPYHVKWVTCPYCSRKIVNLGGLRRWQQRDKENDNA